MHLLANPADHRHRLAEIHLGMPRRMRQRHENLPATAPLAPHMILHHCVAAAIAMLVAQPLEDPLGGMLLLGRASPVRLQDGGDHRQQRPQLGLARRPRPHIPRRRRVPAHLGNRIPAQPENPGCLPPAMPLEEHEPPDRRVGLHNEHLPAPHPEPSR